MKLIDKVILVTGGASGIGLAAVKDALEQGARVVMSDLAGSEKASKAGELLPKFLDQLIFIPADVSSTNDCDALIATTVEKFGKLDGVFNNAGIGSMAPAESYPDEDFEKIIDVNLLGVFRIARAALRQMYVQRSGCIVNCASILGVFGQSFTAAYSASKGAVVNMTRTLALEAAPHGVRVNSVAPGYIDTPMLSAVPEDVLKDLIALHPLGRLGQPSEVAKAACFLLSDDASFITGANLLVDGGFTAGKS